MEKLENDLQKSIESAKELLDFLGSIKCNSPLTVAEQEYVREDIKSINSSTQLSEQAQSKEKVREVWDYFNSIDRDFGGYIGGGIGFKLSWKKGKLWDNLLNSLADSQEVNKFNQE